VTLTNWLWVAIAALVVAAIARTIELVASERDWVKAMEHDGSNLAKRVQATAGMFVRVTMECVTRVLVMVAAVVVALSVGEDDADAGAIALVVGIIVLCIIDTISTMLTRRYRAAVTRIGL
jgi:phosphotransferase system  glucose/maltose/N-acetylglucosamine-specific IIC component